MSSLGNGLHALGTQSVTAKVQYILVTGISYGMFIDLTGTFYPMAEHRCTFYLKRGCRHAQENPVNSGLFNGIRRGRLHHMDGDKWMAF